MAKTTDKLQQVKDALAKAIVHFDNEHIHMALRMPPRAYAKTLRKYRKLPRKVFSKRGA